MNIKKKIPRVMLGSWNNKYFHNLEYAHKFKNHLCWTTKTNEVNEPLKNQGGYENTKEVWVLG